MKPARHLLLVGDDEEKVSLLCFVLRNSRPDGKQECLYAVTSLESVEDATQALHEAKFDLMLVFSPIAGIRSFLDQVKTIDKMMPTLILTDTPPPTGQQYRCGIIYKPSNAELLERVRSFTSYRKPGPVKGSPAAMRVGAAARARRKPVVSETVSQAKEKVA